MPIKFRWPQDINAIRFGSVLVWGGIAGIINTVTGTSPLSLVNALAGSIKSLIQYGLCTQASTPTPSSPVDIKCNNGAIKVSANLLDPTTVPDENKYITSHSGGEATPGSGTFRHSDYIRIVGGEEYFFGVKPYSASTAGLAWYSEAGPNSYISGINGTSLKNAGMVVTAPASANYVRFSWMIDSGYDTNWQNSVYICVNGLMSAFRAFGEVYIDGTPEVLTVSDGTNTQTASVSDLFAVGDYKDEQDIISGLVTRKCRAKVLDGTESYTKASSGDTVRFRLNNVSDLITGSGMGRIPAIFSHFQDLSSTSSQSLGGAFAFPGRVIYFIPTDQTLELNEWKSWLAAQYAAGTPVIILYPLAQETTESVTPQELHSYEGDTTVSWTAEVDGTVKTIEYAQGKQASNKVGMAKVGIAKAG